jgi:hypothetical protein
VNRRGETDGLGLQCLPADRLDTLPSLPRVEVVELESRIELEHAPVDPERGRVVVVRFANVAGTLGGGRPLPDGVRYRL